MPVEKVNKAKNGTVMNADETAKTKSTFREYAEAILMALALALFIRTFIVQAFKIPSGSMIPTLQIGDHILVNKLSYGVRMPFIGRYLLEYDKPQRGEVVVFVFPEDRSKDFIKRVVGVAGDTVEIRGKKVYINGKPLDEPYVVHDDPQIYPDQPALPEPYRSRDHFGPFRVGEAQYFATPNSRTFPAMRSRPPWRIAPQPLLT